MYFEPVIVWWWWIIQQQFSEARIMQCTIVQHRSWIRFCAFAVFAVIFPSSIVVTFPIVKIFFSNLIETCLFQSFSRSCSSSTSSLVCPIKYCISISNMACWRMSEVSRDMQFRFKVALSTSTSTREVQPVDDRRRYQPIFARLTLALSIGAMLRLSKALFAQVQKCKKQGWLRQATIFA